MCTRVSVMDFTERRGVDLAVGLGEDGDRTITIDQTTWTTAVNRIHERERERQSISLNVSFAHFEHGGGGSRMRKSSEKKAVRKIRESILPLSTTQCCYHCVVSAPVRKKKPGPQVWSTRAEFWWSQNFWDPFVFRRALDRFDRILLHRMLRNDDVMITTLSFEILQNRSIRRVARHITGAYAFW